LFSMLIIEFGAWCARLTIQILLFIRDDLKGGTNSINYIKDKRKPFVILPSL
jgi:hypothetical protein